MKRVFRVLASSLLFYGSVVYFFRFITGRRAALILMYHRVVDLENKNNGNIQPGMFVSRETFKEQMRYISKVYNVISLEEFIDRMKRRGRIEFNTCVITFDDGWRDNYTNAYPVLRRYNLPATIFLTTDYINLSTERKTGNMSEEVLEESPFLSWDEIIEMSKNGISFGSHTQTHSILPLESSEKIKSEVHKSKREIEEKIGKGVRTFSYPNGDWNGGVKEIIIDNGYDCACTTMEELNRRDTDPFLLKRKGIHEGVSTGLRGRFSKSMFATHISGIYDCLSGDKSTPLAPD